MGIGSRRPEAGARRAPASVMADFNRDAPVSLSADQRSVLDRWGGLLSDALAGNPAPLREAWTSFESSRAVRVSEGPSQLVSL
ncbi:MAG: hypothetical protein IT285_10620 [Bdellovibrionales bacterium]|nr:hypothetical protein [Bdellovibrionales bacterium]